ncbi:hypothetical protein ACWEGX_36255 [Streptomyces chartreusis]|uniref:hypothetical protein n=1 Tax=Streptomyces TaxID=1883 RepID=UPI0037DA4BB8
MQGRELEVLPGRRRQDHLYDLAHDKREQADRAPDEPALLAELKASWERTANTLLPYPS